MTVLLLSGFLAVSAASSFPRPSQVVAQDAITPDRVFAPTPRSFDVGFESDAAGSVPATSAAPAGETAQLPSSTFTTPGNDHSLSVERSWTDPTTGAIVGAGGAAVARSSAEGGLIVLSLEGTQGDLISSGVVAVGFDALVASQPLAEGFWVINFSGPGDASPGGARIAFEGDSFTVALFDHDPVSGDFAGLVAPPFPANQFSAGAARHMEFLIDLDSRVLRLRVNGVDFGATANLAPGDYRATSLVFGSAFRGEVGLDNLTVDLPLQAAPTGFLQLLRPNLQEVRLQPESFDLALPSAAWVDQPGARMFYERSYAERGTWRLDWSVDESGRGLGSVGAFPMHPNRHYQLSAVVRSNFVRANHEINLGFDPLNAEGERLLGGRAAGLPNRTSGPDGWERWDWSFTSPSDPRIAAAQFKLDLYEAGPEDPAIDFQIADLAFEELPVADGGPFPAGEGVTFRGSAGSLPMAVNSASANGSTIIIETTGARYEVDSNAGTLSGFQRLVEQRQLFTLDLGVDELDLTLASWNAESALLTGPKVSIGIQADGLLAVAPVTGRVQLGPRATCLVGGEFNRAAAGEIYSTDDLGGFQMAAYAPRGSGRIPDVALSPKALPFALLEPGDTETPGAAAPGWTAEWSLTPSDRFFVSVFPCRPYDWELSFDMQWFLTSTENPLSYYAGYFDFTTDWVLWDFGQRAWAMSFADEYPVRDAALLDAHVQAIQAVGANVIPYFSAWFHRSRDPKTFVNAVASWKRNHGVDGMYSDGLPQDDWLVAYEEMRMLRELFPDGPVIIHDSLVQSGAAAAHVRPAIYTYATSVYMAESTPSTSGASWPWVRYVTPQFRTSGSQGVVKGDAWVGFEGVERNYVHLIHGGRGRPGSVGYKEEYLPLLAELKSIWQQHGTDPFFFERWFQPRARALTGFRLGRAAMPQITRTPGAAGTTTIELSSQEPQNTLRYTTDGSVVSETSTAYSGPFNVPNGTLVRARAYASDLDPSRELKD